MKRHVYGFTLLELMVVLVIIGICTTSIGLGMGVLFDPQRKLRQDAQLLAQRLQVAREEARIDGRPIRWQADAKGYRFSRNEQGQWTPLTGDDLLQPRRWALDDVVVQPHTGVELSPEWIGVRWEIVLGTEQSRLRLRDDGSGQIQVLQ